MEHLEQSLLSEEVFTYAMYEGLELHGYAALL